MASMVFTHPALSPMVSGVSWHPLVAFVKINPRWSAFWYHPFSHSMPWPNFMENTTIWHADMRVIHVNQFLFLIFNIYIYIFNISADISNNLRTSQPSMASRLHSFTATAPCHWLSSGPAALAHGQGGWILWHGMFHEVRKMTVHQIHQVAFCHITIYFSISSFHVAHGSVLVWVWRSWCLRRSQKTPRVVQRSCISNRSGSTLFWWLGGWS